jgi:hypothetical protein
LPEHYSPWMGCWLSYAVVLHYWTSDQDFAWRTCLLICDKNI